MQLMYWSIGIQIAAMPEGHDRMILQHDNDRLHVAKMVKILENLELESIDATFCLVASSFIC